LSKTIPRWREEPMFSPYTRERTFAAFSFPESRPICVSEFL
jgi:hypothetical protein